MSRFFVFVIALAAIATIFKYTLHVEGTRIEKVSFLAKTSKRAVLGVPAVKYAGRHWVRRFA